MRVVLVDDDAALASALELVLGAERDVEVVGVGHSGADAVRLATETRTDVVLLDIRMPGMSGLDAAREILAAPRPPRVVFLTTFSDDDYVVRALSMGAAGYLIKQDVRGVAPALRAVMDGRCVLEGEVLDRAVALGGARGPERAPATSPDAAQPDLASLFPQLTNREREVVRYVAEGLDNREVAAAAYMGEGTVRNHISAILAKLGLRNRTQIAGAYWRALRG